MRADARADDFADLGADDVSYAWADAVAYAWAIARSDASASALDQTVADSPRVLRSITPSTRRQLDDVTLRSGTARSDQHGGVLAARGLGAEFSGARSTH